jgi:hypothetical protein
LVVPDALAWQLAGITQLPDEHVPEPLQLNPSFEFVHSVVLAPGVHTSHPSFAVAPDA